MSRMLIFVTGLALAGCASTQQPAYLMTEAEQQACQAGTPPIGSHIVNCDDSPTPFTTDHAAAMGSGRNWNYGSMHFH